MSMYDEDFDIYQPDPYDVMVERELIRKANELSRLKQALDAVREAYQLAKKASER